MCHETDSNMLLKYNNLIYIFILLVQAQVGSLQRNQTLISSYRNKPVVLREIKPI